MSEIKSAYSEAVFRGKILDVHRDEVTLPNGKTTTMEVVYSVDATAVVAVTNNQEVLLINQFRYAAGGMLLEIPAGKMESGESALECARRELEEETGYRAQTLQHLATFYTTPGFCTEKIHLYLAQDMTLHQQDLDRDEYIDVVNMPLDRALEMVGRGEINDAKTIVGLLMAKLILERG